VTDARWQRFAERGTQIVAARAEVERMNLQPGFQFEGLRGPVTLDRQAIGPQFARRPDVDPALLRRLFPALAALPVTAVRQAEIEAKYAGYVDRQHDEISRQRRMEARDIPLDFDFQALGALSTEGREKLSRQRPRSLGQAARIPGVTPADVSILMVALSGIGTVKTAA
jgi:tRNA uridine 5-carboxymethylaminomethyl modification enzyme